MSDGQTIRGPGMCTACDYMTPESKKRQAAGIGDYWLAPSGKLISAEPDHGAVALDLLPPRPEDKDGEVYFDMYKKGYIRVALYTYDDSYHANWERTNLILTPAQRRALEDLALKSDRAIYVGPFNREKLLFDYRGTRQGGKRKAQAGYYGANSPFDSIQLGDQDVRVVTLSTPQEQAQGFQHHKEIPKNYGYLFPNAGGQYFHMQNCPNQILMISLDNDNKVLGKEIRDPETLGKPVAGGKGKHILELHPDYDPYIQVGKRIGMPIGYHSSKVPNPDFDPKYKTDLSSMGYHFGTEEQAKFRTTQYDFDSKNPVTAKYDIKIDNPLKVSHMASFAPDHLVEQMMDMGILSEDQYGRMRDRFSTEPVIGSQLVKILKKAGYDGLVYDNEREGSGLSYVPFEASQIKRL